MISIKLDRMTEKQRRAWLMRYRHGWMMDRIALEMGSTRSAVSRLLKRAHRNAGLPPRRAVSLVRTKPRLVRGLYLSQASNY